MLLFYFFAPLLILQGLVSLWGGRRWLAFVRRETARTSADYAPYASVIVPCRGLDQGLTDNLRALFKQDYPRYEIVFVSDSADDPALTVAAELRAALQSTNSGLADTRVRIAGQIGRASCREREEEW